MEKKLGDMRRQAGKPTSSQPKGRGKEGMYHVMNGPGPCSTTSSSCHLEFDPILVGLAQQQQRSSSNGGSLKPMVRALRDSDSCGNSIHSGDFSFDSISNASSSGRASTASSVSVTNLRDASDDKKERGEIDKTNKVKKEREIELNDCSIDDKDDIFRRESQNGESDENSGSTRYVFHSCASSTRLRQTKSQSSDTTAPQSTPLGRRWSSGLSSSSALSYSITDVSQRLSNVVESSMSKLDPPKASMEDFDDDLADLSGGLGDEVIYEEGNQRNENESHYHTHHHHQGISTTFRSLGNRFINRKHYCANRESGTLNEIRKHFQSSNSPQEVRKSSSNVGSLGRPRRRVSSSSAKYSIDDSMGTSNYSDEDRDDEDEDDEDICERITKGRYSLHSNSDRASWNSHSSTSTLVERRRKMFIAGKSIRRRQDSETRNSLSINEGYKAFERVCLQFADPDNVDNSQTTMQMGSCSQPVSPTKSAFDHSHGPFTFGVRATFASDKSKSTNVSRSKSLQGCNTFDSTCKIGWQHSSTDNNHKCDDKNHDNSLMGKATPSGTQTSPINSEYSKEDTRNAFKFWTHRRGKPIDVHSLNNSNDKNGQGYQNPNSSGRIPLSLSTTRRSKSSVTPPLTPTLSSRSKLDNSSDLQSRFGMGSGLSTIPRAGGSSLRRINSKCLAPMAVSEEGLEEGKHLGHHTSHVVLRRKRMETSVEGGIYPLRRRSSCPSIGAQLALGKELETLV